MWMLKSKFGPSLRSKSEPAQVNELYCKVIAHNLAVLVSAFHELGIDPKFWQGGAVACPKTAPLASEQAASGAF